MPPAIVITFHEVGACAGPQTATPSEYVVFAIDRITTPAGTPFNYNPAKMYVQGWGASANINNGNAYVDPGSTGQLFGSAHAIAAQQLNGGVTAMADQSGAPGGTPQPVNLSTSVFAAVQIYAPPSNGGVPSDLAQLPLFLNYDWTGYVLPPGQTSSPGVVFQKLNLGRGMWPITANCSQINLGLGNFVYALNPTSANATIAGFVVDPGSGALSSAGQAVVPAGAFAIAIEPTGRFLYAVGATQISVFSISQTSGALSLASSTNLPSGAIPSVPAVDPSASFLYVIDEEHNQLVAWPINYATGSLGTMTTAPVSAARGIAATPEGKSVFTMNLGTAGISKFAIQTVASNGTLTPVPPTLAGTTPLPATGQSNANWLPVAIAADQGQASVFVLADFIQDSQPAGGQIFQFQFDPATSAPTQTGGVGQNAYLLATDPYGAALYVANSSGGGASSSFSIINLANPQAVQPTQPPPLQQGGITAFAIDRTGSFVFALVTTSKKKTPANATGAIVAYGINPVGGSLTQLGTTDVTGTFPINQGDVAATGTLLGDTSSHY